MADEVTQADKTKLEGFEEFRRYKRNQIDVRLKLTSRSHGVVTTAFGRGTDISEAGLAAYVSMELNLGRRVDMELTLPYSQQPIKLTAIVRNRRGHCYGD